MVLASSTYRRTTSCSQDAQFIGTGIADGWLDAALARARLRTEMNEQRQSCTIRAVSLPSDFCGEGRAI